MKNIACMYAIVRFCPFIETEEFANVGVILIAPGAKFFGYQLMTRKHARVTNFFEHLDPSVFRTVIANLKEEFDRVTTQLQVRNYFKHDDITDVDFARTLFGEIVRPRETVIKFSTIRAILTDNPKEKLGALYDHYVERDFITKEYRETVLERTMRTWIHTAGLGNRFDKREVGNEDYYATFPFVEESVGDVLKAVKPLNLAHDQPSKILDHGGQWLFRIQTLKRRGLLPKKVLFAVDGPQQDGPRQRAYDDMVDTLRTAGATVINYHDKDKIMDFVSED
jgi:hypothetical protein